jgi:hypothetical protein
VAAALTYEMPLLLAQLFGARAALAALWVSVSTGTALIFKKGSSHFADFRALVVPVLLLW